MHYMGKTDNGNGEEYLMAMNEPEWRALIELVVAMNGGEIHDRPADNVLGQYNLQELGDIKKALLAVRTFATTKLVMNKLKKITERVVVEVNYALKDYEYLLDPEAAQKASEEKRAKKSELLQKRNQKG